jgi:hypothetical protein
LVDDHVIRRAFQLARLSEELALMSERLEDQAHLMAKAAADVAHRSEQLFAIGNDRPIAPNERE